MKKLKVLAVYSDNANSGVGYYRLHQPLVRLAQKNKIVLKSHGYNGGQKHVKLPEFDELGEWCKWADILMFERNDLPQFISLMLGAAKFGGIPAVVSYDDNVNAVRPWNPGYRSFCPNSKAKKYNIECVKMVDGLIVTTSELVRVYEKYNKNIYICPNSLDFEWRDKFIGIHPSINKKVGEFRIGWAGSSAHWENLHFIEPVIYDIMDKYKNVTFHYTGMFGDLFKEKGYEGRIKEVGFADLIDWPKTLAGMGLDIAIAPLCDNLFNRAKSNLRCLEYQAAKYPLVASDVEPYRYIKHKKTGMLVKELYEWKEALIELIEKPYTRRKLSEEGYKQAKKCYNIDKNCEYWLKAIKDIIKKHKRSL